MSEAPAPISVGRPSEVVDPKKAEPKPARSGGPIVHHVIRTIARGGGFVAGSEPIEAIEEYLLSYFRAGWTLREVVFLEKVPEGFTFCWVLYRE